MAACSSASGWAGSRGGGTCDGNQPTRPSTVHIQNLSTASKKTCLICFGVAGMTMTAGCCYERTHVCCSVVLPAQPPASAYAAHLDGERGLQPLHLLLALLQLLLQLLHLLLQLQTRGQSTRRTSSDTASRAYPLHPPRDQAACVCLWVKSPLPRETTAGRLALHAQL